MSDTLFDPDVYGPGRKRTATRERSSSQSLPVEDHVEPWCVLRTRRGVLPFFHLPRGINDYASTVALCGATGTKVHNIGVDQMVRCPLCQLETEL